MGAEAASSQGNYSCHTDRSRISHHGRARTHILRPSEHSLGDQRPVPPPKSAPLTLDEILLQQDEHRHEHLLRNVQLLNDPASQVRGLLPQQPREGSPGGPGSGMRHLPANLAGNLGYIPLNSGMADFS